MYHLNFKSNRKTSSVINYITINFIIIKYILPFEFTVIIDFIIRQEEKINLNMSHLDQYSNIILTIYNIYNKKSQLDMKSKNNLSI